jgi:hypothetical protein
MRDRPDAFENARSRTCALSTALYSCPGTIVRPALAPPREIVQTPVCTIRGAAISLERFPLLC